LQHTFISFLWEMLQEDGFVFLSTPSDRLGDMSKLTKSLK